MKICNNCKSIFQDNSTTICPRCNIILSNDYSLYNSEDLVDDITLAYSITVHKAQGSQWNTVIVPVYQARNLDRSMLYTAITRAKTKVIMIGDLAQAKKVTQELPKVFQRTTGLKIFLKENFENL